MNPFKFLIDEVKKDIQTIKDIREGKSKFMNWEDMDFKGAMKTYWPWFLLLIAAFLAGLFFGSILAHNHYIEVIEEKCPGAFYNNDSVQQQTKFNIEWQTIKEDQSQPTNALDVTGQSKRQT